MVIIQEPQFLQVQGSSIALDTDMENRNTLILVPRHERLVSKTARIDRKAAAEMLALTLRPLIAATSRLSPAAAI
ncbi:hypothetical protein CIW48_10785 [Methylobacterium sp. P1-11]|nr:hypothetical protein CIW48_10785 [Methylobacterium sp. P1-11]